MSLHATHNAAAHDASAGRLDMLTARRKPLAPGPNARETLQLALVLRKSPAAWMKQMRRYGDVARYELAGHCVHLLSDPADIQYVIETNADNYSRHPYEFETLRPFVGNAFAANERPLWALQRHAFEGRAIQHLVDTLRI